MNYQNLAFTDAIKKLQEKSGSRNAYENMEKMSSVDGLTENEIDFISNRDSFYMASFGENIRIYSIAEGLSVLLKLLMIKQSGL